MANKDGVGGFQKNFTPWNKGSKGLMGFNVGRPKGYPAWNKGIKVPQMTGSNNPSFGKYFKWTDEQKQRLKEVRDFRKENHPNWVADRSQLVKSEKKHLDGKYREWMFSVKNRDGWKCRISNSDCNGRLESHHILNWKEYPELRYELNNGITLCHAHHPRGRENESKLSPYFNSLVADKQ